MKRIRIFLSVLFAALIAVSAEAQSTIAYSYDNGAGDRGYWGNAKKENYDVAIRIVDANLVGAKITGVKVPFTRGSETSNHKIWLSSALTLETIDGKKQNVADIASVDATEVDGELTATFAEPYTITEEGVYVGYSFDIDNLNEYNSYPIAIASSDKTEGLYMHSSRTYRAWVDMSEAIGYVSPMVVYVEGDFAENSVGIASVKEPNAKAGDPGEVTVTLVNNGSSVVSSIDYSYAVADITGENSFTLPEPIPAQYNAVTTVKLPLPAVAEKGAYALNLAVTKVNGVENSNVLASATTTLNVLSMVPVNRPLLEEYTGFWCGFCPRGFVALELMNKYYPDLFVGVSYHNADILEIMPDTLFPNNILGFPSAYLNRVEELDPYHGYDYNKELGIADIYLASAAEIVPVAIDVVADWADESQEVINVTTSTTFVKQMAGNDYRVVYMLIADDLHGEGSNWSQSNYFSGDGEYAAYEGFEPFVNGESYVDGLHFNDILVLTPDVLGIQGSLPEVIVPDETVAHEYSFAVADAVNTSGQNIIQDKSKLRVVVAVVDATTGEVLNANKAVVGGGTTGITSVQKPAGDILSVSFFDASGRKVAIPSKGMYIKSVVYKDGSVETSKVLMK